MTPGRKGFCRFLRRCWKTRSFVLNAYRCISREQMERFLYQLTYGLIRGVVEEKSQGTARSLRRISPLLPNFYKYSFVGIMLDWIRQGMTADPTGDCTRKISTTMQGTVSPTPSEILQRQN